MWVTPRSYRHECSCFLRFTELKFTGTGVIEPGSLWNLDQLHLSVAFAVKDEHLVFVIPEDEDVAIAEGGFLDGFFKGHRTPCRAIDRSNDVGFDEWRFRGKRVDDHGHSFAAVAISIGAGTVLCG